MIRLFYERIKDIETFDFNKIYGNMDDFCSFRLDKQSNIKSKMKEMVELINKYNVLFMKSIYFSGYETGIYDEYILYKYLCPSFQKVIDENPIKTFNEKRNEFLAMTKINVYLEKDYKEEKQDSN